MEDFSQQQKRKILKRDNYKCVVCGRGKIEGVEIGVDHIKPKEVGGKAIIENGQTLCAEHNNSKNNLGHTDSGKNMFIRMYEISKQEENEEFEKFCVDVLEVYDRHGINEYIEWKK